MVEQANLHFEQKGGLTLFSKIFVASVTSPQSFNSLSDYKIYNIQAHNHIIQTNGQCVAI